MYTSVIIARKSLLSLQTHVPVGALLIIKHLPYPILSYCMTVRKRLLESLKGLNTCRQITLHFHGMKYKSWNPFSFIYLKPESGTEPLHIGCTLPRVWLLYEHSDHLDGAWNIECLAIAELRWKQLIDDHGNRESYNNDRRTQIVSLPLIQNNLREDVFEVKITIHAF